MNKRTQAKFAAGGLSLLLKCTRLAPWRPNWVLLPFPGLLRLKKPFGAEARGQKAAWCRRIAVALARVARRSVAGRAAPHA